MTTRPVYNAEISAGSLLLGESRVVARLLLEGADAARLELAIIGENALQKRSPATSRRMARLIRKRLALVEPSLVQMAAEGSKELSSQALMVAAVKHSRLLGDFLGRVVREKVRTYQTHLTPLDWRDYLEACRQVEPSLLGLRPSTEKKLFQVILRILAEGGYLTDTRSRKLQPVALRPEIKEYLLARGEEYVLSCMDFEA